MIWREGGLGRWVCWVTSKKLPKFLINFGVLIFKAGSQRYLKKKLSWQTSLQCIVGDISGGGSIGVAVGFIGFGATIRTRREI